MAGDWRILARDKVALLLFYEVINDIRVLRSSFV